MVVLLLGFEKAYDRVDLGFLEGSLSRFSFEEQWIRGVATLYRSASSHVLLAGGRGPSFNLSRSVRQGCPLAPFLFLFFVEVMCTFLVAEDVGLRGLQMPIQEEALLDAEFADDTSLYLQGHEANLVRAEHAIETFCTASGARIN